MPADASPRHGASRQPTPKRIAPKQVAADRVAAEGSATTVAEADARLLDGLAADVRGLSQKAGLRNLLAVSEHARLLASCPPVRRIPEALLGRHCFVTRAILFDKSADANWKVPWHQDLAIAVASRHETNGFGPWSEKDGVVHVQPPIAILAAMVTVRVHLDDCGLDNGPVRVLAKTHKSGKLTAEQIAHFRATIPEVNCTVRRGGLLAFRPLLLHASSAAVSPGHRRVAHFEFAAQDLPGNLNWHVRWF